MTIQDHTLPCGGTASSSDQTSLALVSTPAQRVVCGDALDVLGVLPSGSIDVVVTAPPCDARAAQRGRARPVENGDYLAWMNGVADQIARVLRADGAAFIIVPSGSDPWEGLDVALQFRRHLVLQNVISWITSIHVSGVTRGHVRPLKSERFLNRSHAAIYHYTKRGDVPIDRLAVGVPYADKTNLRRWKSATQDLRCAGNSWFIPHETITRGAEGQDRRAARFPLDLPRRCLRLHGGSGTVLDPFLGSGTTLVAAQELGWRGIGIELNPEYAEMARGRIADSRGGP